MNENSNVAQAMAMLKRMAHTWKNRAQVKQFNADENIRFEESADDYLVDLLPFKDHPDYTRASLEMKKKILSCGWIIYNQKTIAIETEIINPACVTILRGSIPGATDSISKKIVSETMVDESYHVLLVLNSIEVTSQNRNLFLQMPTFNLVKKMKMLQSHYASTWQGALIELATAMVSEILITDYLKLLSENEEIQPINRLSTKVHREDELAHSNIFKNIIKCVYTRLSLKEKEFFANIFTKPIGWFADVELDVWCSVLQQIGFSDANQMIRDCKHESRQRLPQMDYSPLIMLANEIGIKNDRLELF